MLYPILLLLAGLALIGLDVVIPSAGILSLLGGLCLCGWIVTAFLYGGVQAGTIALLTTAILLPLLLYLIIRYWPHTPIGRAILIGDANPPQRQGNKSSLIGRTGRTTSRMLPSGAIEIEGRTYTAMTEGMPLDQGVVVEVVAEQGNSILVRPVESSIDTRPNDNLDQLVRDPFEEA